MNNKKILIASILIMLFAMNEAVSFMSYGFGDSVGAPMPTGTFTYLGSYNGCQITGCHVGNPVNDPNGSFNISTNIPSSGWDAGQTYDITVNINYPNKDVFGFKIASWGDVDSASVGSFSLTDTSLQLQSSGIFNFANEQVGELNYVTHTRAPEAIISTTPGTRSWTFQWIAPSTQDQNVKFYAAGNAANGNGQTTGDFIYYTERSIGDGGAITTGITDKETTLVSSLFPNPVNDRLQVNFQAPNGTSTVSIEVFDLSGRTVIRQLVEDPFGTEQYTLNTSELKAGVHMVKLIAGNSSKTFRVIKL